MTTGQEDFFLAICLEGFFYGLYVGIFAMYLQCQSNTSRTATIVFYAVCLLYALSTVSFVSDLVALILESRISTLSIESELIIYRIGVVQSTASGCCDFLAQCILIYRCWIVWGQDILIVTIPSFLAIAYLATWLATVGPTTSAQWGVPVTITSLVLSMAVNTMVTGLIVFKILKVSLEISKATVTSVERTLGSTAGVSTKFRHALFVIIESGMALFAIQMVRFVLSLYLSAPSAAVTNGLNFVILIHEMVNGITPTIILVRVSMKLSFDNKESFMEAAGSLRFNNTPSDPNTLQHMGSGSSGSGMLQVE